MCDSRHDLRGGTVVVRPKSVHVAPDGGCERGDGGHENFPREKMWSRDDFDFRKNWLLD